MAVLREDSDWSPVAPFWASGEIDFLTAPAFIDRLCRYAATTLGVVVLDCTELTFIDSSGVAALVAMKQLLHGFGRPVVLRNLSGDCYRTLETLGLLEQFGVWPTRDRR